MLPVFRPSLEDGPVVDEPRAVDQHVGRRHRRGERGHRRVVRHVQPADLDAGGGFELAELREVDVRGDQRGALAREGERDRPPDALGGGGDQGCLSSQPFAQEVLPDGARPRAQQLMLSPPAVAPAHRWYVREIHCRM